MIVLLDTSGPTCKLTLINDEWIHEASWEADRNLARGIFSFIEDELDSKGKKLMDIKKIGVKKGPGSFTGIRIGLTVLNTIADAQGIPIVGESGEDWQREALRRLNSGENDRIVMPFYDRDLLITRPRK